MVQSSEYPDLAFRAPKSFTRGRAVRPQLVVMHTTEGHEHAQAAEDGAAYDGRRTDGTSCHYFHDPDSTVQCVLTTDTAHSALFQGNRRGIHHELCGRAGQTPAQWNDAESAAILRRAARQVARDCRKHSIPPVKLTAGQVARGDRGICGHAEITFAFPEDGGDHTDPGRDFPWPEFLALVRAELNGDDDMTPEQAKTLNDISYLLWNGAQKPDGTGRTDIREEFYKIQRTQKVQGDALAAIAAKPAGAVVLSPEQLETLADRVVEKLTAGAELAFRKATP